MFSQVLVLIFGMTGSGWGGGVWGISPQNSRSAILQLTSMDQKRGEIEWECVTSMKGDTAERWSCCLGTLFAANTVEDQFAFFLRFKSLLGMKEEGKT